MKTKVFITIIITIFIAASLFAQDRVPKRAKILPQMTLNLTEEQKSQLEELKKEYRKEVIKIEADLKIAKIELKDLLSEKDADETAVLAKADEVSRLQNKLMKYRISHQLKTRKIYTEEQWKKLKMRKMLTGRRLKNIKGLPELQMRLKNPGFMRDRLLQQNKFDMFFERFPQRRMMNPWWIPEPEGAY